MATITGTISWDPSVLNNSPPGGLPTVFDKLHRVTPLHTSKIDGAFVITADQIIPPVGFGFGTDQVIATGHVISAYMQETLIGKLPLKLEKTCYATYEISDLPLHEQLFVIISAGAPFIGGSGGGISAVPLGGPSFVTLTGPAQSGPNFFLQPYSLS
jgi:hypothetical protein